MGLLSQDPHSRAADEQGDRNNFDDMGSVLAINGADVETPFLPVSDNNGGSSDEETQSTTLSPGDTMTSEAWAACMPKDVLSNIVLETPHLVDDSKEPPIKFLIPKQDNNFNSEEITAISFIPTQIWPQVMAAVAVSLGSMIIGFGSAYTSTALPTMSAEYNSTIVIDSEGTEASWIGSLLPLGALLGGISGGSFVEYFGRKSTILATAIPFILSWLLIAFAQNIWMLYIARSIAGFSIGIASLSLPVYLAETVQPEVRGVLGLLPTCIGNIGILICFTAGSYMTWDSLATLGACLSVPFLVCMCFIPETPRWYIAKGREECAEKALQWLRGSGADIRAELNEIKNTHLLTKKYSTKLKDLFGKTYRKSILASLGLMFFQQFSGINAVIFYTVYIFELSHSSIDSNLSTIIVGLVNFGAVFVATLLIDRLGRKVLLLISNVVMIFCLSTLAAFFYLKQHQPEMIEDLGWIPLASFILFVIAFSLGFGPIPWLMMGEIFPGRIRGSAAAVATAFNWSCTFIVTKTFPEFVSIFGGHFAFLFFAIICFIGFFFIIFCVPETQGKSLEDIERNLTRPFRRISSTANLKPLPMGM
ncbi:unnamed protein product [Orchesella dallaii]|uniref:Major facilitator superfamily (MFS) profile domain-containing protein n=1 Tax=Orchesella dallaii TaxID=48710 RepID=A0ABP1QGC4_9HEXA